jgi:hypothetical protein
MFAVYGPPSASNPIGFCHVKAVSNSEGEVQRYICTGKDCRSFFSKAKQTASKVLCIHLHILSCFAGLSSNSFNSYPLADSPSADSNASTSPADSNASTSPADSNASTSPADSNPSTSPADSNPSTSSADSNPSTSSQPPSSTHDDPFAPDPIPSATPTSATPTSATSTSSSTSDMPLSRSSTLELYKDRKLPYKFDNKLLREIVKRDSNSALELLGGWPDVFFPDEQYCSLCNSELSPPTSHPGQSGNSYLLTECNPFKKVCIQVKFCKNKQCKAMYQVFPIHAGVQYFKCYKLWRKS